MLDGLFRPRAVAVIGASANPLSIGHIVVRNLLDHEFKGPIFPINPKGGSICSIKAYRSISEVPDQVDLVNISIKAEYIPAIIDECGRHGVKFAIVHSAGFKEVGEEGVRREREMVEIAHRHGMRIYGPNSQGIQNSDPEVSVYANFTFVPMKPGNISIIAQGGGMGELLKLHLSKVGLGHRLYCSYGNECDLTMPEILEYYGQDEGTRVIMMQTESFKDPRAFLEVAARITPHKPILAIKAGRTPEGSVAVSSHTGSLVDQAAMAEALYRKAGVVQFTDSDEMIKAAIALACQNVPRGRRLGLITNTGGPGIQAVDEAVSRDLVLAEWSEAGRQRLEQSLYAEASCGNPVDVVATAGPEHYFAAVDTLLKERDTDMVMVFLVTAPFVDLDGIAERIAEATADAEKPVVVVVETTDRWARLIERLRGAGLPVYEFAEDGVRALADMVRYGELQRRPAAEPPALDVDRQAADAILEPWVGKDTFLPQTEAYRLLAAYGIPAPALAVVSGPDDLDEAVREVGFPCVLKVDSADVVHKSDEGGVVLGLETREQLEAALATMRDRFRSAGTRFVVQRQAPSGCELILGAKEAPGLGALVMFGLGGVMVEVLRDVSVAVAPLATPEADALMRAIAAFPVLTGVRGRPGVDLDALRDLLLRFSRLAADHPAIREMDLNPVLAYPRGEAPLAVDVRIRVR